MFLWLLVCLRCVVSRGGKDKVAKDPCQFRNRSTFEYAWIGQSYKKLDLILPEKPWLEGTPFPVMVFFHGFARGGLNSLQCTKCSSEQSSLQQMFLAQGVALAVMEYRTCPEARFPAQIYDAKAAVRWLRMNAAKLHLDKERIGCFGSFTGAGLCGLLAQTNGMKDYEGCHPVVRSDSQPNSPCRFALPSLVTVGVTFSAWVDWQRQAEYLAEHTNLQKGCKSFQAKFPVCLATGDESSDKTVVSLSKMEQEVLASSSVLRAVQNNDASKLAQMLLVTGVQGHAGCHPLSLSQELCDSLTSRNAFCKLVSVPVKKQNVDILCEANVLLSVLDFVMKIFKSQNLSPSRLSTEAGTYRESGKSITSLVAQNDLESRKDIPSMSPETNIVTHGDLSSLVRGPDKQSEPQEEATIFNGTTRYITIVAMVLICSTTMKFCGVCRRLYREEHPSSFSHRPAPCSMGVGHEGPLE